MSIRRALTRNHAATAPDAGDPRLRGRDYAVPFGRVWRAALDLAGSLRGWTMVASSSREGVIRAEARTSLWRFIDDVEIRITLDADGLTRVDMSSASRFGGADLGANARRIDRFLRRLDARLSPSAR